MQKQAVAIVNKLGLHARASAKLTQAAARFPCTRPLRDLENAIVAGHAGRRA